MASAPMALAQPRSFDARAFLDQYCVACHNQKARTAGLALDIPSGRPAANPELWERVNARLRAGSMPPPGPPRPNAGAYRGMIQFLEGEIDRAWSAQPNPGRIHAVHRVNRMEYNNAIRDLFALDIDVKPLLPGDETADGSFDNIAEALSISTAHLERYLSLARHVTRLAVGLPPPNPSVETFAIPLHVLQEDRQSEDLPLGSRGGIAVRYHVPADGEYTIRVRLQRQYQDYIKGMGWAQRLDVRVDGALIRRFTVGGGAKGRPAAASYAGDGEPGFAGDPEWERYMQVEGDAGLEIRLRLAAGPRVIGVSFVREAWESEGLPQPLQRGRVITNDQVYMNHANIGSVQIGGPHGKATIAKDTPSRRAIFVCRPSTPAGERPCAARIVSQIARLAFRRPVTSSEVDGLLRFFDSGRQDGGSFDSGIQLALERILADPDFLLRIYRDKPGRQSLSPIELASRLSFFLWNSLPDDKLLTLAGQGRLSDPATLGAEARRLLSDARAVNALVDGFAAQWLNLRRIHEAVVDQNRYPNYDESLLEAFEQETRLFTAANIREDRAIPELLSADYTFANERLARHYGIDGVHGSRFRRVALPDSNQRGGLLAQGSLLVTTSYPDRTSPVLRGKWLLNNIFGIAVPPPPEGVDTNLEAKPGAAAKTIREKLARHRENPACNSCHTAIDPLGFALENFDVIGGWRTKDETGRPVDTAGATAGGERVDGLPGLRRILLADPEQFPRTVTEKLLAYALGRRIEYYDQPAIRKIVREAASSQYRWSSIILGIVQSPAFVSRSAPSGGGK